MHNSKAHGEVEIELHLYLASVLTGVSGQLPALAVLHPEQEAHFPRIGGWVELRRGLDVLDKRKILSPANNKANISHLSNL